MEELAKPLEKLCIKLNNGGFVVFRVGSAGEMRGRGAEGR
jgi:hypothetical protein